MRSTSHKPPRFRITMRHAAAGQKDLATAEAIAHQSHDHGDEGGAALDSESAMTDGDDVETDDVETSDADEERTE